jgi:hypothetical protein
LNASAIGPEDLAPSLPLLPPRFPERTPSLSPLPEQQTASSLLSRPLPPLSRSASSYVNDTRSSLAALDTLLKNARKEIARMVKNAKRKQRERTKAEPGRVITAPEAIEEFRVKRGAKKEKKKKAEERKQKKRKRADDEEKEQENVDPNPSPPSSSPLFVVSHNQAVNGKRLKLKL